MDFSFPYPVSVTAPVGSTIDRIALGLLQPAVQERCFPLSVEGDGNCFFRSLSLVLFGTEACFEEMRCRIAMAMALAPNIFLDGSNWCSAHDQVTPESVIQVAVLTSVAPDESPAGSLEQEVMSVLQNRSYTGLWEFLAASYVLKRPILSVFPPLGWELYRVHCNRIIRAPGCNMDEKIAIMWSSVRSDLVPEHWTPNHFVPIVLARIGQEVPKRGTFHMVQWQQQEYLAEVRETDELLEIACGLFFHQKHGTQLFSAPTRPDYSWEPFSSISY